MSSIFIVYTCTHKRRKRILCTGCCRMPGLIFLLNSLCLQYALGMILCTTIMPTSLYWYTITLIVHVYIHVALYKNKLDCTGFVCAHTHVHVQRTS